METVPTGMDAKVTKFIIPNLEDPNTAGGHGDRAHRRGRQGHQEFIIPNLKTPTPQVGMEIVPIGVDAKGNVDIGQLREKASHYKDRCAVLSA